MTALPFALQLYSVRDHLERDLPGTLRAVKAMGYDAVEIADTQGHSPAEYGRLLAMAGLRPISAHLGFEESVLNPAGAIAFARDMEVTFLVVPWLGKELCPDVHSWGLAARAMNQAGATLREAGIRLCYHNHAEEFTPIEGVRPFDLIFEEAAPENLAAEIDTYWAAFAGEDPAALIARFAGRCPLLHIKDMSASGDRFFAEVGQGIIDWPPIFEAGQAAGAEWLIVEQDESRVDSLESAATSAQYMREHCGGP